MCKCCFLNLFSILLVCRCLQSVWHKLQSKKVWWRHTASSRSCSRSRSRSRSLASRSSSSSQSRSHSLLKASSMMMFHRHYPQWNYSHHRHCPHSCNLAICDRSCNRKVRWRHNLHPRPHILKRTIPRLHRLLGKFLLHTKVHSHCDHYHHHSFFHRHHSHLHYHLWHLWQKLCCLVDKNCDDVILHNCSPLYVYNWIRKKTATSWKIQKYKNTKSLITAQLPFPHITTLLHCIWKK